MNDVEDIYSIYKENKIGSIAAAGALAAGSVMGGGGEAPPSNPMVDSDPMRYFNGRVEKKKSTDYNLDTPEGIANLWADFYQTKGDTTKKKRAVEVLENGIRIPKEAEDAIDVAVYIFGGDMGIKSDVLERLLIYTGGIESNYETKVQDNNGPARGYWQVEPRTAIDHFINGKSLMGKKFKAQFGETGEWLLNNIKVDNINNREIVATFMEENDEFAAAMSALTWIRLGHKTLSILE